MHGLMKADLATGTGWQRLRRLAVGRGQGLAVLATDPHGRTQTGPSAESKKD